MKKTIVTKAMCLLMVAVIALTAVPVVHGSDLCPEEPTNVVEPRRVDPEEPWRIHRN